MDRSSNHHNVMKFQIPSVHDGAKLECVLFDPNLELQGTKYSRGAVVAHPFAPLGGNLNDPVVQHATEILLRCGHSVLTFNFRGAGASEGKTSWSAKPEIADYVSCAGYLIHYLHRLQQMHQVERPHCNIVFAGYSYGSMITSMLPSVGDILQRLLPTQGSDNAREIMRDAYTNAERGFESLEYPPKAKLRDETVSKHSQSSVTGRYLLISPLLPPVTTFVAPFSRQVAWSSSVAQFKNLTDCETLLVFGDNDVFTSAKRLRNWSEQLAQASTSRFQYKEIAGAGHFWNESGAEEKLMDALAQWIQTFKEQD